MPCYLHFIWWRPREKQGLNRGMDGGDQTAEVFGVGDGEMEVFMPLSVYVCVGVDLPLAMYDSVGR